ncbi:uncharacterized protein LOC128733750 isoform X2 [Sabethes cyaneus]|uniref:uncharacterized protein LOC128733750 isoform X2 n=1 Tax=Sabethes cyaneus TaxID=53552 RepID=UPI00237EAE5F|nr:uncharacterized protein LOC128733750 isoform X2 [Sabethes cyaneus]
MDVHQIKKEPRDDTDLEQRIPRHLVQRDIAANISVSVNTIDLTRDEYFNEFESFLNSIQDYRKPRKDKRIFRQLKHVEEVLALQTVHLQLISFYQEAYIGTLFGINFKNVMIYGRIIPGAVRQENNTQIYKLDDGSGTVDVHYAHGLPKDVENLVSINKCEDILATRSPLNEEQVPDSTEEKEHLKLLLALVKNRCQQRLEYFTLGTRCFVIGRPFLNRWDRVSIYAYTMHADADAPEKSAEVFWKTHLAICYEQRYAPALGINQR